MPKLKPSSKSKGFTANLGFEAKLWLAPYTAQGAYAITDRKAIWQSPSVAKDRGHIFDPASGSGGVFVQSVKFVESHDGNALTAISTIVRAEPNANQLAA